MSCLIWQFKAKKEHIFRSLKIPLCKRSEIFCLHYFQIFFIYNSWRYLKVYMKFKKSIIKDFINHTQNICRKIDQFIKTVRCKFLIKWSMTSEVIEGHLKSPFHSFLLLLKIGSYQNFIWMLTLWSMNVWPQRL